MMHDCSVCGTVMPGLREFHGWEFDNGRSVYGVAFQLFESRVCRYTLCAEPFKRWPDLLPINLKCRTVDDFLTDVYEISRNVSPNVSGQYERSASRSPCAADFRR